MKAPVASPQRLWRVFFSSSSTFGSLHVQSMHLQSVCFKRLSEQSDILVNYNKKIMKTINDSRVTFVWTDTSLTFKISRTAIHVIYNYITIPFDELISDIIANIKFYDDKLSYLKYNIYDSFILSDGIYIINDIKIWIRFNDNITFIKNGVKKCIKYSNKIELDKYIEENFKKPIYEL